MSSNSARIIEQLHHDFQELMDYVTGEGSQSRTAYEVELTLFRKVLALGAQLLRLFFVQRGAVRPDQPVYASDGTRLEYRDRRPTTYFSVFGKVRFCRSYFHVSGHKGVCPLDAELSLPAHCYSDLLRDWAEYGATDESYDQSIGVLKRILGLSISKLALEKSVEEDATDMETFYEQRAIPSSETEGSILVVQVDGKGVPMKRDESAVSSARPGKGQKRAKKKEAIVTAIYSIEPYVRTPQDVVEALLPELIQNKADQQVSATPSQRPVPQNKEVRGTLDGKDVAFERLLLRVAQREGDHIEQQVALTDGAQSLQDRVEEQLPQFALVLDIIHATEYLWKAANALMGETHPDRIPWVGKQLLHLLCGHTPTVIQTLQHLAQDPARSATQRQTLKTIIGYYQRNLPYMHYDQYLAKGWPIGTGVVEGACGHLVKDRMEQSGMRWTKPGAQAILDLRAARINDHWEEYQRFHRRCQHQRLYGDYASTPSIAETLILSQAA